MIETPFLVGEKISDRDIVADVALTIGQINALRWWESRDKQQTLLARLASQMKQLYAFYESLGHHDGLVYGIVIEGTRLLQNG